MLLFMAVYVSCTGPLDLLTTPGDSVVVAADDGSLSPELRYRYWRDAAVLAVREINQTGGEQNLEIELPVERIQFYYDALVRVYNARRFAARNEVVRKPAVHTFESPRLEDILFRIDPTIPWIGVWISNWLAGDKFSTGNAVLDSLLIRYDLTPQSLQGPGYCAHLLAGRPLNLEALGFALLEIPGVVWAAENALGCLGSCGDIIAESHSDHVQLCYVRDGFGLDGGAWMFAVYADGTVVYVCGSAP
jgi:hypothetical protein